MPVVTPGATTVGAVQISGLSPTATPIESWLNGCLQGKAFATVAGPGPTAGQYTYIELRNPTGSGRNLWVYAVIGSKVTAGWINLNFTTPPIGAGVVQGLNLLSGVSGGVARLTQGSVVAPQGTNFGQLTVQASVQASLPYPWSIVIAPNCALFVNNLTVNEGLTANFMWMEV